MRTNRPLCDSAAPDDFVCCNLKLGHRGPCSWETPTVPKIDARNGCYGNEEETADDGVLEVSCGHGARRDSATTTTVGVHETPAGINPKYDGNLLPAMTAMVTGFVDKLTNERAKLFRETTTALLPEFAHLLKHEGGRNEIE